MMKNKRSTCLLLTALLLGNLKVVIAQSNSRIYLDSCIAWAMNNYPVVRQYGLIERSETYAIENVGKRIWPQFGVFGQATYQSEVTQIPLTIPNMDLPVLNKDQYRLYGEISQPITDLFTIKDQRDYISNSSAIEAQKVDIELHQLKDRIHQLYFSLILLAGQMQQTELLKADIESGIDQMSVAVANGVATESDRNNLQAELLKVSQRTITLKENRKGYAAMLSHFIGKPVDESTRLEVPAPKGSTGAINRPELELYRLQKATMDNQYKLLTTKNLPRLSVFFQGGLGRPALNMLNPDMQGYYIAGLKLSWNIMGLYTYKNDKSKLAINKDLIDIGQETFLFNTRLSLQQQQAEITKMQELISSDADIISLREGVKNTAKIQLQNGIITTNDYLTSVNAADQARQQMIVHKIELLQAQYKYQAISGN